MRMTRAAEVQAAAMFHAVQQGQSLDAAAAAAGLQVSTTPALTRNTQQGVGYAAAGAVLFSLKQGQATMLQTGSGFTVAVLTQIVEPEPGAGPQNDVQQLQQAMTRALQNDVGESFLAGLQARDKVSVNQKMLAQIYQ